MTAAVGADVEALCSKCGDVWHVVVAKVGEQIVKVQCKQCGGYHRYKSPHGTPAAKRAPAGAAHAARDTAGRAVREAGGRRPTCRARSRTYRASEKFEVGDRIDHPSFGQGVIETAEPGKITVFFATGRRVLVQAKEAPSGGLSRPKPFDHAHPPAGGKPVGEN